jgi:hypothetical protein
MIVAMPQVVCRWCALLESVPPACEFEFVVQKRQKHLKNQLRSLRATSTKRLVKAVRFSL